ncbi:MAG TPA: hypothetical protein VK054_07770, partial [Beutenbergiaceae bacterium]|nr:hypothetical protein [Beutenbergiaceae bacterium]
LLLAGVVAGKVGLAGGMLVHEASVIAVVLNALRIVGYRGGAGAPSDVPARTSSVEPAKSSVGL